MRRRMGGFYAEIACRFIWRSKVIDILNRFKTERETFALFIVHMHIEEFIAEQRRRGLFVIFEKLYK